MNAPKPTAWYRDPWRWLVITPPLAAVLAGAVTTWLAIRSWDGLVVDDYYKEGLEINQVLARDERAAALGLAAAVAWDPRAGRLQIDWQGGTTELRPPALDVQLIYATRAGLDRRIVARQESPTRYVADAPDLRAGQWHVHVSAGDWRVTETLFVP